MVALKLWFVDKLVALRKEDGAAAVEYGLLVGLIAVAIIATVTLLGDELVAMFDAVAGALSAVDIPAAS